MKLYRVTLAPPTKGVPWWSLHDVPRAAFDALPGTEAAAPSGTPPVWCKVAAVRGKVFAFYTTQPPTTER